jgi:hypothetical protein
VRRHSREPLALSASAFSALPSHPLYPSLFARQERRLQPHPTPSYFGTRICVATSQPPCPPSSCVLQIGTFFRNVDEPDAKVALLWMVAEYGHVIPEVKELSRSRLSSPFSVPCRNAASPARPSAGLPTPRLPACSHPAAAGRPTHLLSPSLPPSLPPSLDRPPHPPLSPLTPCRRPTCWSR